MAQDARPEMILTLSCPDRPGIVHAISGALLSQGANIEQSQQYSSPDSGRFFMRLRFSSPVPEGAIRAAFAPIGDDFDMDWSLKGSDKPLRTLIMVSTQGHCLNELMFRQASGQLPISVPAIVSNHRNLEAVAEFYNVPFHYIPVSPETKGDAERRLLELVDELDVELVVLARYMQVLSDEACRQLSGRAINIHHSFLPSFKGARPYAQAHARGVKLIGATAHYITADLDEGPIIDQDVIRVNHQHDAAELSRLGQNVEARTLAQAVGWQAQSRVLLDGHRTVVFD